MVASSPSHTRHRSMSGHGTRGNVRFIGVARLRDRVIVASYTASKNLDLDSVRSVVADEHLSLQRGVCYNFAAHGHGFHVLADTRGRIYMLVTDVYYPEQAANLCLSELEKECAGALGDKVLQYGKEGLLNEEAQEALKRLVVRYDEVLQVDRVAALQQKVSDTSALVQKTVVTAIGNDDTLQRIEQKAEILSAEALQFKKRGASLREKVWWKKNWNVMVCVAVAALICTGAIGLLVLRDKRHHGHKGPLPTTPPPSSPSSSSTAADHPNGNASSVPKHVVRRVESPQQQMPSQRQQEHEHQQQNQPREQYQPHRGARVSKEAVDGDGVRGRNKVTTEKDVERTRARKKEKSPRPVKHRVMNRRRRVQREQ